MFNRICLAALLVFITTSASATVLGWEVLWKETIGVSAEIPGKGELQMTTTRNDQDKRGLALFYIPNQIKGCSLTDKVEKTFRVNGVPVNFVRFCIDGDVSMITAYRPASYGEVKLIVAALAEPNPVTIGPDTFSTENFIEKAETLLK